MVAEHTYPALTTKMKSAQKKKTPQNKETKPKIENEEGWMNEQGTEMIQSKTPSQWMEWMNEWSNENVMMKTKSVNFERRKVRKKNERNQKFRLI